jgi:hypothetical protein
MSHHACYALLVAVAATALSQPPLVGPRKAAGPCYNTAAQTGIPSTPLGRRVTPTPNPLAAHATNPRWGVVARAGGVHDHTHEASLHAVPMFNQAAVAALAKRHALTEDVSEEVGWGVLSHLHRGGGWRSVETGPSCSLTLPTLATLTLLALYDNVFFFFSFFLCTTIVSLAWARRRTVN